MLSVAIAWPDRVCVYLVGEECTVRQLICRIGPTALFYRNELFTDLDCPVGEFYGYHLKARRWSTRMVQTHSTVFIEQVRAVNEAAVATVRLFSAQ